MESTRTRRGKAQDMENEKKMAGMPDMTDMADKRVVSTDSDCKDEDPFAVFDRNYFF